MIALRPASLARFFAAARGVPPDPSNVGPFSQALGADRWRLLFLAAVGAVVVVSSVLHGLKAAKPSRLGTQTRSAFLRWREQLQGRDATPNVPALAGLKQGADIYRLYNFPTPPVTALILYPFTALPPVTGALVWFYLKAGLAAASLVWAFRFATNAESGARNAERKSADDPENSAFRTPHSASLPDWAKAGVILLSLHPILGDLSHGNVNLVVGFLVFAGLECFRRRWDAAAGLVIGLAVAAKVTPGLFLPYFVWKRAWRAAAATLAGVVLWTVAPAAVLGWDRNVTFLEGWFDGMVRPFLIDGKVTPEHANQSIPGLVNRLLTHQPSDFAWDDDDRPVGTAYHNVADLSPGQAKWVIRGCQAAFGLAVVLCCTLSVRRPTDPRQGVRLAAEVSLIVLGMLLFSERTWKHHAVTLMLPYACLAGFVATRSGAAGAWARARAVVLGVLGLAAGLAFVPSFLSERWQNECLAYGTHTAVFVLLAIGVCVVMRAEARAEPAR